MSVSEQKECCRWYSTSRATGLVGFLRRRLTSHPKRLLRFWLTAGTNCWIHLVSPGWRRRLPSLLFQTPSVFSGEETYAPILKTVSSVLRIQMNRWVSDTCAVVVQRLLWFSPDVEVRAGSNTCWTGNRWYVGGDPGVRSKSSLGWDRSRRE